MCLAKNVREYMTPVQHHDLSTDEIVIDSKCLILNLQNLPAHAPTLRKLIDSLIQRRQRLQFCLSRLRLLQDISINLDASLVIFAFDFRLFLS